MPFLKRKSLSISGGYLYPSLYSILTHFARAEQPTNQKFRKFFIIIALIAIFQKENAERKDRITYLLSKSSRALPIRDFSLS
jgi:hypothetical protein